MLKTLPDTLFAGSTPEQIRNEVEELLDLDAREPSGAAHVAASVLRRFPETHPNVLTQIAVLEGTVVQQRTKLQILFWVSMGSLLFSLLRRTSDTNRLGEWERRHLKNPRVLRWLRKNPPPDSWQDSPLAWAFTEMPFGPR